MSRTPSPRHVEYINTYIRRRISTWTIGLSTSGDRISSQQAKTARDASDGPNVAPAPILAAALPVLAPALAKCVHRSQASFTSAAGSFEARSRASGAFS